jgi:hypothetical protein
LDCSAEFKWHKQFAEVRENLEDNEHTGLPRTVRTESKIQGAATLAHASCSQEEEEVAAVTAAGISHGTCHKILSDNLNMPSVTQHIVSCIPKQDHHDDCMSSCSALIDSDDRGGMFLNQIIIGT